MQKPQTGTRTDGAVTRKKRKSNKGSAFVIAILLVFFATATMHIMAGYHMQNALLARTQRERMQAYYIMYSGLELGVNALLIPGPVVNGEQPRILDFIKENPTDYGDPYADPPEPTPYPPETIPIGETGSKATVSLRAINEDGETYTEEMRDDGVELWVEIYSIGQYYASDGLTEPTATYAGSIYVYAELESIVKHNYEKPEL